MKIMPEKHFLVLVKIGRICNKVSRPLFEKFQTVCYRSRRNYFLWPRIRNRLLSSNYIQWLLSLSIEQKNSIIKGSLFSVLFAILLPFSIKQFLAIVVFSSNTIISILIDYFILQPLTNLSIKFKK
jgi:hypothetical protein